MQAFSLLSQKTLCDLQSAFRSRWGFFSVSLPKLLVDDVSTKASLFHDDARLYSERRGRYYSNSSRRSVIQTFGHLAVRSSYSSPGTNLLLVFPCNVSSGSALESAIAAVCPKRQALRPPKQHTLFSAHRRLGHHRLRVTSITNVLKCSQTLIGVVFQSLDEQRNSVLR